jgi:hypothetical protein
MKIFNSFRRFFRRKRAGSARSLAVPSPETMLQLLKVIQHTQAVEFTCADVYRLADQYAEMTRRHEDVARLMPLVQHHLTLCASCREELEALLRMLEVDVDGAA